MLQENTDLLPQLWGEIIIVTDTGLKSLKSLLILLDFTADKWQHLIKSDASSS